MKGSGCKPEPAWSIFYNQGLTPLSCHCLADPIVLRLYENAYHSTCRKQRSWVSFHERSSSRETVVRHVAVLPAYAVLFTC